MALNVAAQLGHAALAEMAVGCLGVWRPETTPAVYVKMALVYAIADDTAGIFRVLQLAHHFGPGADAILNDAGAATLSGSLRRASFAMSYARRVEEINAGSTATAIGVAANPGFGREIIGALAGATEAASTAAFGGGGSRSVSGSSEVARSLLGFGSGGGAAAAAEGAPAASPPSPIAIATLNFMFPALRKNLSSSFRTVGASARQQPPPLFFDRDGDRPAVLPSTSPFCILVASAVAGAQEAATMGPHFSAMNAPSCSGVHPFFVSLSAIALRSFPREENQNEVTVR